MKEELNRSYNNFKERGYNTINTLKPDNTWLDIKEEFKPDIVFFSNPWDHTKAQYQIHHFFDALSCYVHYGFDCANLHSIYYNMPTIYLNWKVFVETQYHKDKADEISPTKGKNFIVTGYPGIDNLIDKNYIPKNVWKSQSKKKKRLIWAPHHTLPNENNLLNYSNFLDYSDLMLELALTYQDEIQICFKPHPNLKGKLYGDNIWGIEKTDAYYKKWEHLPNGQLNEGDYIDLFIGSDGMIHDCSSFHMEYFFTGKPVMFLIKDDAIKEEFNELGREGLKNIDLGYNKSDIINFIDEVIIKGEDKNKSKRAHFLQQNLMPPNNKLASENIYNYLKNQFN